MEFSIQATAVVSAHAGSASRQVPDEPALERRTSNQLRKEQPMSNLNIILAWKDEDYRRSLTDAQRAQLPANPAGVIEFQDRNLEEGVFTRSPCHKCSSTG
jgi:mersacidin/lichenicidin family type 2 lantibiotic